MTTLAIYGIIATVGIVAVAYIEYQTHIIQTTITGLGNVISNLFDYSSSETATIELFIGKSNPRDLEKGMSDRQKELFQRAIEDYKEDHGMRPDFNLPWKILVMLAEMIREMYK